MAGTCACTVVRHTHTNQENSYETQKIKVPAHTRKQTDRHARRCTQVFVQMAPFLKNYAPFLKNAEWTLKQIEVVKQSDPKFRQLLARKSSMGIESLESLVIKPVQRIPRWVPGWVSGWVSGWCAWP